MAPKRQDKLEGGCVSPLQRPDEVMAIAEAEAKTRTEEIAGIHALIKQNEADMLEACRQKQAVVEVEQRMQRSAAVWQGMGSPCMFVAIVPRE